MLATSNKTPKRVRNSQSGMTLVETLIALAVLFVMAGGLLGIGAVAMITSENQGHLAARTAEYAQDKMEQLMSIPFANNNIDTFSITPNNCVLFLTNAACNTGAGLSVGGTSNPACGEAGQPACINQYVDYLDINGNPLGGGVAAPAGWYYRRVWRIEDVSPVAAASPTLKRITVAAKTRYLIGGWRSGKEPRATVVMLKSAPF
jgi:hypothetical protein